MKNTERRRHPAAGGRRALPGGPDALAAEFDPRLAEVWLSVFDVESQTGRLPEQVGWLLRMAYLKGYEDGLTEPERGSLLAGFGLSVPVRRGAHTRSGGAAK